MNWIKNNLPHVISIAALIVSTIMLLMVYLQLSQANEHKKWENYNSLNLRYYEWYSGIEQKLNKPCPLTEDSKNLARTYFDLYSEEYWLLKKRLIPEEMWHKRIDRGVDVNLINFPALVTGYNYWKKQGAFNHPEDFIPDIVEKKLEKLKSKIKLYDCEEKKTKDN